MYLNGYPVKTNTNISDTNDIYNFGDFKSTN